MGTDPRRSTPVQSPREVKLQSSGSMKETSSTKRRSRSKSPFRSFRWKRGSSRAVDSDDEGGIYLFVLIIEFFFVFITLYDDCGIIFGVIYWL